MKTFREVAAWFDGACRQFEDPSIPICQLFFRWHATLEGNAPSEELACGLLGDEVTLLLGPGFPMLPMPIEIGAPKIEADELLAYGATKVTDGVWALSPSLNAEGLIHAFVVIHNVPDPAPWERRIVLP